MLKLEEHVGCLGRATTQVWLFLFFLVFPSVISGLQVGGVKVLVGFKNVGVLFNSRV